MSLKKKYIKYTAVINLTVQLLIIGISSLHYHNLYNLSFNNIASLSSNDAVKVSDPFLSNSGQCKLLEFIHTTYNTIITPSFAALSLYNIKIIDKVLDYQFYKSFYGFSSSLRAPPAL
ncbi:hypothetical protein ABRY23_01195 [Melioribacteraceae bacterium 4301-Me]|uniref:hypothetical protein n=1 Tax=Pyranulibacter aquaticus TaxID=3163344 RepID=UPI00359722CE